MAGRVVMAAAAGSITEEVKAVTATDMVAMTVRGVAAGAVR